jgi:hypothetical protein
MLHEPLTDAHGAKLNLAQTMPGLGVEVCLTSADGQVVRFVADAAALSQLAPVVAAAAEVAQRAVRRLTPPAVGE